jgi:hypothetical protein
MKIGRVVYVKPVDYRTLDQLRKSNPAWRLLVADNAPMIVTFL